MKRRVPRLKGRAFLFEGRTFLFEGRAFPFEGRVPFMIFRVVFIRSTQMNEEISRRLKKVLTGKAERVYKTCCNLRRIAFDTDLHRFRRGFDIKPTNIKWRNDNGKQQSESLP